MMALEDIVVVKDRLLRLLDNETLSTHGNVHDNPLPQRRVKPTHSTVPATCKSLVLFVSTLQPKRGAELPLSAGSVGN